MWFINWCNPNWEVIFSMVLPLKFVLSWLYQLQDLGLMSTIIVVRREHFCARISNVISKLLEKVSKSSWDWLGDLQRAIKLQDISAILSSKFRHSFK